MKTQSLEILEKSQLPAAQSHAILKVMEMEIAAGHQALATKFDLLELKSDFKSDFARLELAIAKLKAEMNKIDGGLSRWVLTCILGQTALLAGLGYFVLQHSKR
jgi:hypothetical protein